MTRIASLAIGALLALSTVALAHAGQTVAGVWKLSIGVNEAPCTLTLATDAPGGAGLALASSGCVGGLDAIGRWKATDSGLQLFSPSSDMVAWLKEKNGNFEGSRLSDGKKLALDR